MSAARPISTPRDPFAFECGWTNALAILLALVLLLLNAPAMPARAQSVTDPRNGLARRFSSDASRALLPGNPSLHEAVFGGLDRPSLRRGLLGSRSRQAG